ncbi:MAG: class IV adenylate cyclase [Ignavibacteria bacterium]
MKKNLEIKCKLENYNLTKEKLNFLTFSKSVEKQIDTYYNVSKGRLKLRVINDKKGFLIFYQRAEETVKRISKYTITRIINFKELNEILKTLFGINTIIKKKREIYIQKNIRVHLDTVKDLGSFLEIEVIYNDLNSAKKQLDKLILLLGLSENDFIKNSYSDLLIKK